MEIDSEHEDIDIVIEPGTIFTRLTPLVRKVYFNHLRTSLQKNAKLVLPSLKSSRKLRKCVQKVAEQMEMKAIKASVVTQLYQQEMQAFIKNINRSTSSGRAEKTFLSLYNESESRHGACDENSSSERHQNFKTVDSEDEIRRPLDLRLQRLVDYIPASYAGFERDLPRRCTSASSKPSSPEMNSPSRLMESGFMDASPAPQWHAASDLRLVQPPLRVATPIFEPPPLVSVHGAENDATFSPASSDTPPRTEDTPRHNSEPCDEVSYDSVERHLAEMFEGLDNAESAPVCNGVANLKGFQQTDLSQSVWPCRLYMEKQRLNDVLYNHNENDFRRTEEIKCKFYTLFGEDSDDEFNLQSPRIDHCLRRSFLNNIFKQLWPYLLKASKEGLIANRYLLKRLGKQLTQAIYAEKHYPTDAEIKTAVYNFFCVNRKVKSIADTDNIPGILTRRL